MTAPDRREFVRAAAAAPVAAGLAEPVHPAQPDPHPPRGGK